jgi:phage virion morphogenesis protein
LIRIDIDDDAVTAALANMSTGVTDMTPVMNRIGAALVASTKARIAAGVTPEGTAFAPRSQVTLDRYARTGQKHGPHPLTMDGYMAAGIAHQYGPDYAEVGSNAIQAAVMQMGAAQGQFGAHIGKDKLGRDHFHSIPWGDIPARPFLGLSEDDRNDVLDIIGEWLEAALNGGS